MISVIDVPPRNYRVRIAFVHMYPPSQFVQGQTKNKISASSLSFFCIEPHVSQLSGLLFQRKREIFTSPLDRFSPRFLTEMPPVNHPRDHRRHHISMSPLSPLPSPLSLFPALHMCNQESSVSLRDIFLYLYVTWYFSNAFDLNLKKNWFSSQLVLCYFSLAWLKMFYIYKARISKREYIKYICSL